MATIYDVAKMAGVSPKTVSRVLNRDAPVGKKTKETVQAAIEKLGYVPSNAARMMRSSRSGLIGLITGAISLSDQEHAPQGLPDLHIVQGIQRVISNDEKTLMIADTGGDSEKIPHLMRTFVEHRVEGLIYVADRHRQVELPLIPVNTPMVLANCFDELGTPAVIPDDTRGQFDLVSKLVQTGHKRIGYLTLPSSMIATTLRIKGYENALKEAGIPFDPTLVISGGIGAAHRDTQVLWDAIDRLLNLPEPPTVLCCGNDEMAMKVYGILRTRGLRVPEDISVAGYDNHQIISETLYPPLTTVELAYGAIGARAAEQLLALIGGEQNPQTNPTLVSGPVSWRSSVTVKNSITKLSSTGRKI